MTDWSIWKAMPSPAKCREIEGPEGPGIYQIRNKVTGKLILFGISIQCCKRMKSFFPKPYGTGTRNNENKRQYISMNWRNPEFRTRATETRAIAKQIEDKIKAANNHLFNT